MARARNIKPGFFRNAELVELPVETRLLFIGLWTLADREGRLEDRPKQIKMEIFPADGFDVGSMLDQLQASGFISRYEVESSKFIEVNNFIKHQDPHYKEKASEIPPPPGKENFIKANGVTRLQRQRILERDKFSCTSCSATENLCIDHVMPVSRGGDSSDDNLQVLCGSCNTKKGNKINGEEKNSRHRRINIDPNSNQRIDASPSDSLIPDSLIPEPPFFDSLIPEGKSKDLPPPPALPEKRATRLPKDWQLPKQWGDWALTEYPLSTADDVRRMADTFKDHWIANASRATGKKDDWLATWRNWVRNSHPNKANVPKSGMTYHEKTTNTANQIFGRKPNGTGNQIIDITPRPTNTGGSEDIPKIGFGLRAESF